MLESLGDVLECPICLETMVSLIKQCRNGHSICDGCASSINRCPLCNSPITTTKNYQLEQVIASLKEMTTNNVPCKRAEKSLRKQSTKHVPENRAFQCQQREYICEGKNFANWNCNWKGAYENIFQHFKTAHNRHTRMDFQTSVHFKVDLTREFLDIQIIPYNNGKELFWYKHKIDIQRAKANWLCQYVGPTVKAHKYFYEFTIRHGPQISKICESDSKSVTDIIDSGNCISLSLDVLKDFLNENDEIVFTLEIREKKGGFEHFGNRNVDHFISSYNSGVRQISPPNMYTLQEQQILYNSETEPTIDYAFPANNFQFNEYESFTYPEMPPSVELGACPCYNPCCLGVPTHLVPPYMDEQYAQTDGFFLPPYKSHYF